MKTLEEFKALKRNEMFDELAKVAPTLAKGMSRAKKDELIKLYSVHITSLEVDANLAKLKELDEVLTQAEKSGVTVDAKYLDNARTGRFRSDVPNPSSLPRSDERQLSKPISFAEAARKDEALRGKAAYATIIDDAQPFAEPEYVPQDLPELSVDGYPTESLDIPLTKTIDDAMKILGATVDNSLHDEITYTLPNPIQVAIDAFTFATAGDPSVSMTPETVDAYKYAASKYFDVPLSVVTAEQRNAMKTVLWAHIYGRDASSMRKALGITDGEEALRDKLFEVFPQIKAEPQEMSGVERGTVKIPELRVDGHRVDNLSRSITGRLLRTEFPDPMRDEKKSDGPVLVGVGYGGAEIRMAASLMQSGGDIHVVEGPSRSTDSPDAIEIGEGITLPGTHRLPGRRDVVYKALIKLPKEKLVLLSEYKRTGNHNRKARLKRAALAKTCRRFLPENVTLDEAVMVIA